MTWVMRSNKFKERKKKYEAPLLTNIMLKIGIEKKTNCMRSIYNKNK
jgi:hypothetical protein